MSSDPKPQVSLPTADAGAAPAATKTNKFDPSLIERPAPVLLKYYALVSLASGPAFPFAFVPLLCKYLTLRYKFEEDGVSMKWGVLFRKEINLTYRRIQDIHLTNNIFQRWMGLANVAIQTASGSSAPEMTIEGVLEADLLRDYLYAKMRGAKGLDRPVMETAQTTEANVDPILDVLIEIRNKLRTRTTLDPSSPVVAQRSADHVASGNVVATEVIGSEAVNRKSSTDQDSEVSA